MCEKMNPFWHLRIYFSLHQQLKNIFPIKNILVSFVFAQSQEYLKVIFPTHLLI